MQAGVAYSSINDERAFQFYNEAEKILKVFYGEFDYHMLQFKFHIAKAYFNRGEVQKCL